MAIGKPLPLPLALTFTLALFMTSLDMDPQAAGRQRLLAPFNKEPPSSSFRSLVIHLPMLTLLPLHYLPSAHASAAKARSHLRLASTTMGWKGMSGLELLARANANGYKQGAYRAKDSSRDEMKYMKKTLKDQSSALERYEK